MVLNDRERVIAWVVGSVVAVAGLWYLTDALYFSPKAKMIADYDKAVKKYDDNNDTIHKGREAYNQWASMSIPTKVSDVEQPTRTILFQLAQQYNFQISNWSNGVPRGVQKQPDFQEVPFSASANTTTARLGHFLAMLESQRNIAVRIDSLSIESRKPGQDDLHVEMSIKALVYTPKALPKEFDTTRPPSSGATRPANATTKGSTGALVRGGATAGPEVGYDYGSTYNILNAPLGSLDPGLPLTDEAPMDQRLLARREYQLDGKKLPKPRYGDDPVELKPNQTMEQALAERKAAQIKAAATQAVALEEQQKKEEEANAPKLLPGETMDQYMVRHRQELEAAAATQAASAPPATQPQASNMATTTQPSTSTAPGGVQ